MFVCDVSVWSEMMLRVCVLAAAIKSVVCLSQTDSIAAGPVVYGFR